MNKKKKNEQAIIVLVDDVSSIMMKSKQLKTGLWSLYLLLMLLLCCCGDWYGTICDGAPIEDKIESLPLYGVPPTPQYSGYLNGTAGCDITKNGECYIHYWFATAIDNANNTKPTILWMNGGPGSSSILGLLQELGPLLMNAIGRLMDNPYSWTNVANVLVLESPVGVGYSYCTKQQRGDLCYNTDKYTASAARVALVDFYTNKFPELARNDFYITGESYAGVYVPTLAYEIMTKAKDVIPLKGIAVGDPCTDNRAQDESMDPLWYGHKYGLVDDAIYDTLWHKCQVRLRPFHGDDNNDDKIHNVTTLLHTESSRRRQLIHETLLHYMNNWKYPTDAKQDDKECRLAYRKFLLMSSRALSQGWKDLYIDDYSFYDPATPMEDEDMGVYMNRMDVRKALHVEHTTSFIPTWPYPKHGFHYKKEYKACSDIYDENTLSMIDFHRKLSKLLDRIWIYNGDTDPCVSYEGTRNAVKWIGYPELDGGSYRPWFYNLTATSIKVIQEKAVMFGPNLLLQNVGSQFGGEVVNYEHNVTFFTIHGAGHMVPQFRPQAALHFITKFVNGEMLSPLLPSNATLIKLSDDEFETMLDTWTETAMKAPYVV